MNTLTRNIAVHYTCPEIESQNWEIRALSQDAVSIFGRVRLRRLLECTSIGVVFHLHTSDEQRRQGIASAMLDKLESHAVAHDISLLIATVKIDNMASPGLFDKRNYARLLTWRNPVTGSDLILFAKTLK